MADENNYSDLIPALRFNLRETVADVQCDCPCASGFTDAALLMLLEKHGGDLRAASYEGLLLKAEDNSLTLPDGLQLGDNRDYWLRLASLYRPTVARNIPRADEIQWSVNSGQ